jgi:hypothetical protein
VVAEGMLADVIVVRGDVATDVAVLSDRANVEVVIRGGVRVPIQADLEAVHHDRAQTISAAEVTWELVHGERDRCGPADT